MSIGDLFWLFVIVAFVWPWISRRMLETARYGLIKELEKKRGSRVIVLIHRQETMSFLGFPVLRYIDIEDSEDVLRAIKLTDDDMPIDLILHTPGGLVLAAEQIAHALCRHKGKVTVFVPHYAMSGGTLLALAADEIVMDDNAVLGPVDPQIGEWPAASVLTVLERKNINDVEDETIVLADQAAKAINEVRLAVRYVLTEGGFMAKEKAGELAEILATGTWTHDYPISIEDAQGLGLPVSTDVPEEVYKLMALYRQAPSRRVSVGFVPVPYQQPPKRPGTGTQP